MKAAVDLIADSIGIARIRAIDFFEHFKTLYSVCN
jgi:hypothetical protein